MTAARLILLFLMAACIPLCAQSARSLARQAAKAEKSGKLLEAIGLYNQATAKNPQNLRYERRARALAERAARDAATAALPPPVAQAPPVADAKFSLDAITAADLRAVRDYGPPPELTPRPGSFPIDLRGSAREIFTALGKLFGFEVLFDDEYPTAGPPLRLRLDSADARTALRSLEEMTGSFAFALRPSRVMVVRDTPQKRTEREPTVAVALTLPDSVTPQDLQECARTVQQVMELQKLGVDNAHRIVILRDRLSKVRPAQRIFEQLIGGKPMISVELDLIQLSRQSDSSAGMRLPSTATLFALGDVLNNKPTLPQNVAQLVTFGAGKSLIGITLSDAQLVAQMTRGYGTTLSQSEVRTLQGQPATFVVGDRFPILTAGYFGEGVSASSTDSNIYRPPPSFQYENLGLSIKVVAFAHGMDEISLEVEAEYKLLSGQSINGIPILSNRKFTSKVRMRNNEWAVLAGLGNKQDSLTVTGPPLLSKIPGLGALLRQNTANTQQSDTVVILKPKLLSLPTGEIETTTIFLGAETRPAIPL